jgi:peptidoglycan/LPS O-acetylase OafA/YrhL
MTSHSPTTAQPALARYDFIDALRGLAFLGVLVHHTASRIPHLNPAVLEVAEEGHEGVELFFLISALTLFFSLDARRRSERRPNLNFFIRRFFRIAPLFYVGALFYFWFDRVMTGGAGPGGSSIGGILATLAFVNGWSADWINRLVPGGWSIAVEMNFYLIVPWMFRRLRGVRDATQLAFAALMGGGAASVAMRWLLTRSYPGGSTENILRFVWYWLPTQLPIFCLGFVLFFVIRPVLKDEGKQARSVQPNPHFLLLLAAYLLAAVTFSELVFYLGHILFGVAFLLLAWSLALYPNAFLVNPVTQHMGKVSFSAYISHFAVLDLVERGLPGQVPSFAGLHPEIRFAAFVAICTVLTVAVSTLTYRLIEVPGQELGRRLIRFLEARETLKEEARHHLGGVIPPAEERLQASVFIASHEPVASK